MSDSQGEPCELMQPVRRYFHISQTYRRDDPILRDRYQLERRLTDQLIRHMRIEGVDVHDDTCLPGFVLAPDRQFPEHMTARLSVEIATLPKLPAGWLRG